MEKAAGAAHKSQILGQYWQQQSPATLGYHLLPPQPTSEGFTKKTHAANCPQQCLQALPTPAGSTFHFTISQHAGTALAFLPNLHDFYGILQELLSPCHFHLAYLRPSEAPRLATVLELGPSLGRHLCCSVGLRPIHPLVDLTCASRTSRGFHLLLTTAHCTCCSIQATKRIAPFKAASCCRKVRNKVSREI